MSWPSARVEKLSVLELLKKDKGKTDKAYQTQQTAGQINPELYCSVGHSVINPRTGMKLETLSEY